MIEEFLPKVDDYFGVASPSKKGNVTELIGLRLTKEYSQKLKKIAFIEKREPITILRAITMQALDKVIID